MAGSFEESSTRPRVVFSSYLYTYGRPRLEDGHREPTPGLCSLTEAGWPGGRSCNFSGRSVLGTVQALGLKRHAARAVQAEGGCK